MHYKNGHHIIILYDTSTQNLKSVENQIEPYQQTAAFILTVPMLPVILKKGQGPWNWPRHAFA